MEVSYTLTEDDLRAYLEWSADQPAIRAQMRNVRRSGTLILILLGAVFVLTAWSGDSPGLYLPAAMCVAGAVGVWIALPRISRARYAENSMRLLLARKTGYLLGRRTMRISAEGFALSGPGISASYSWSVIDRVECSASAVYVLVGPQSAHVVPRSAFPTAEEMQAFATAAQGYLSATPAA